MRHPDIYALLDSSWESVAEITQWAGKPAAEVEEALRALVHDKLAEERVLERKLVGPAGQVTVVRRMQQFRKR